MGKKKGKKKKGKKRKGKKGKKGAKKVIDHSKYAVKKATEFRLRGVYVDRPGAEQLHYLSFDGTDGITPGSAVRRLPGSRLGMPPPSGTIRMSKFTLLQHVVDPFSMDGTKFKFSGIATRGTKGTGKLFLSCQTRQTSCSRRGAGRDPRAYMPLGPKEECNDIVEALLLSSRTIKVPGSGRLMKTYRRTPRPPVKPHMAWSAKRPPSARAS